MRRVGSLILIPLIAICAMSVGVASAGAKTKVLCWNKDYPEPVGDGNAQVRVKPSKCGFFKRGESSNGGAQASASIKRMLSVGNRVRLIRDRSQDNRDSFDRLLRYVERRGRDIGRRQIRRGWAKAYVFERPFKRVGKYRKVEARARARSRGVWDQCGGDFHLPL